MLYKNYLLISKTFSKIYKKSKKFNKITGVTSSRAWLRGMAIEAGVRRLPKREARSEHDEPGQPGKAGCDERPELIVKEAIDTHTCHVNKSKDWRDR